ncbi:hypothetical protein BDV96DRAFT_605738 [Lophiotrema nucula]|uniref:Uncharacterized protein n=1 Tax=Lophiotrema nucula TaxID=690887 RepID=A0A6A5YNT5_9PLEO|nr:hypothetical protein BDV96DRAFT_605738 [Lophiotrema nucula]
MCLFKTTETRSRHGRGGVLDPPPHSSRYSAYPVPGVARVPHGYRRDSYDVRRVSRDSVEYRASREAVPRAIEYYDGGRGGRDSRRSVDVARGGRGSGVGFVDERRRSVSRVRY